MPQALRNFSNDEVRQIFSRASSAPDAKAAAALDELERHAAQWKLTSAELKDAIDQIAAVTEQGIVRGFPDDVDRMIEDFQQHETDENALRASIERVSFVRITNPDLLSAANKALALYLDISRSVSQAYHDARWRLMEARAKYRPSSPAGQVHGEMTDLDTLIKS